MPLIDEKGKIFGRFNIIDILLVLIILIAGLVFVLQKPEPVIGKIPSIKVKVFNVQPFMEEKIITGDKIYNIHLDRYEPIATIKKLDSMPALRVVTSLEGAILAKQHPLNKDVLMELIFSKPIHITAFKQTYGETNKTINVRVGKAIDIDNYKYELQGQVVDQNFIPEKPSN